MPRLSRVSCSLEPVPAEIVVPPPKETKTEIVVSPQKDVSKNTQEKILQEMELHFKEATGLKGDLSKSDISRDDMQVETDEEKSDKHGEVFTPIGLVDEMIERIPRHTWKQSDRTTFDLCSGYGQFSIRMLRKRYGYIGEAINIPEILFEYHLFAEIQPGSCFRLLYIFGEEIRLLIGDVSEMGKLPDEAEYGIWVYNKERWEDRTEMVLKLFHRYNNGTGTVSEKAEAFEKAGIHPGLS